MAVIHGKSDVSLVLKVITGTKENGTNELSNRTISDINPEISDADLFDIGEKLAACQSHELSTILRSSRIELTEDE